MAKREMPLPTRSGTLAKLNRPWLPTVFPRGRLFAQLDELADRPCTWIGAPGGYGKTTLAVSYVEARGVHCLWYQLDEDDADLATFFYHLGIAATGHTDGLPLPLLTPEYQGDIATFTRRYFQALCQRLNSPFILLFDNYQRLAAEPFDAMLSEALSHLPSGVRCLITSRGEPPATLARARLHGQLAVIDAEALRLTLPEAEGIAGLHVAHQITANEVRSLYERVHGWAAGLTLLLQYSRFTPTSPRLATTEIVFDYFATEVFQHMEPATQTFLLKTALLPKMTAAMANQLTGDEGTEALLNDLVRNHYFTVRDETAESSYQYHDLFRDFLLNRSGEIFSATEREQDQRRAATILEAVGELSAAVELRQALGDWEQLSGLINQHAETLLRQGRSQLLESWLTSFPHAFLKQSPWLLFWLGQCQLPRDAVAARTTLARAYRRFKHAGEVTGLWLAWAAITDTYVLAWDNFRIAGGWLVEFERLRTRYPSFASTALEARVTCGVFNLLIHTRPDHPEFADWEQRINRLLQGDCPPDLYLVSLNNLLFHYIWNVGQHSKATLALNHLRAAHTQTTQIEPVLSCAWLCWEFCYQYWYEGDLEHCLALAEDGWDTAVEHGISLFNSLALSSAVYVNLSAGRVEAGRAALARFEPVLKYFRPVERGHYAWLSGWEAWLSGRLPEALDRLEQSLAISSRAFYQSVGFSQLALAQLHASLGQRAAALRHLAGMRHWIRATHSQNGAFLRTLAAAQFALDWGRQPRALGLLRRALALGREQSYIFFPFFKPEDVVRLCVAALDADIEVEYVQTLIRKRGLLPDQSMTMPERWPCPVKIYTLGRFALVVDDQPVSFGRKAQHKPLELLKILIARGGRDVHQTLVADALWPDADGDAAQQVLTTTTHRLRRLLNHEQALGISDGRLFLDPRYCWVDIWNLERHINEARGWVSEANDSASPAYLERLTHSLLSEYRGSFLGQDPEAWALQTRDRLRDKYLKCLDEVGACWEKRGDSTMARACHERILDIVKSE